MLRVSIVMPAYNAEQYIAEAIESILEQTFTDFEFIIINDGSIDKTKEIIQSYGDSRIVYLENIKNLGIVATLNKGVKYASGEYIARMDADDIALPERLEKQVKYMDCHRNIGVLGTGIRIFGEDIPEEDRLFEIHPDILKAELLFNACIAHPTVLIRKSVLEQNSVVYEERFSGIEDFALWWKLAQVSKLATIPEVLYLYRIHESQITQRRDVKAREVSKDFLKVRMKDLKIQLTHAEIESILMYCRNESEQFTMENVQIFVDVLSKILKKNKEIAFFDKVKIKKISELAVIGAIKMSGISDEEAKIVHRYAIRKKIYSNMMMCKLVYCKIFK